MEFITNRLSHLQISFLIAIVIHAALFLIVIKQPQLNKPSIDLIEVSLQTPEIKPTPKIAIQEPIKQAIHPTTKKVAIKPVKQVITAPTQQEIITSPIQAYQPIAESQPQSLNTSIEAKPTTQNEVRETTIEIGSQKLPLDQEFYISSMLNKIKVAGERNYPKDAEHKSLKIKIVIDSQGYTEQSILRSSGDEELDLKVLDLIKNVNPFAKPTLIKIDRLTVIRVFKYE